MNENFKNQGTEAINGDAIIANAMSAVEMETVVTSGLSIVEFPLGNGQLSQSDFNNANTIYVIKYDFTFSGSTIFMKENCVLEFRGGSLSNGTLIPKYTKIVGNGHIFGNNFFFSKGASLGWYDNENPEVNPANRGHLANTVLLAEWFGVKPNSGDQTDNINKAIAACQSLVNVKTLLFAGGIYEIENIVKIGGEPVVTSPIDVNLNQIEDIDENLKTNLQHWDINLVGASNGMGCGTVFYMGANGSFNINMVNVVQEGEQRGGGIYNCYFRGYDSDNPTSLDPIGNGIVLQSARTYTIYKCRFHNLLNAIRLNTDSYYCHVESCILRNCEKGISYENYIQNRTPIGKGEATEQHRYTNNNIVSGCMIEHCGTPLDLLGGHGIHIYDTDVENENGTILLGDHNRLDNVRIERNLSDKTWLEIGSDCTVDVEIHGEDEEEINWRCVTTGNYNDVRIKFCTYNRYGFVSYGRGNKFDITTETSIARGNCATYMVYDPEDTLIVNDRSNKHDYEGENLINYVTFVRQTSSSAIYREEPCYPIVNSYNQAFAIRMPNGSNGLLSIPTYYITCKFRVDTTTSEDDIKLGLLENPQNDNNDNKTVIGDGITLNRAKAKGKWFGLVAAFNKPSTFNEPNINTNLIVLYKQEAGTNQMYLIDVVFSTTLLFERPVLAKSEGSTFNLIRTDGVIHLPKNKLNHVLSTFSMEMSKGQIYSNWLGKQFRHDSTKGKYYSDGCEVSTKTEQTISGYAGLIQGLTDVEVELCDVKDGDTLRFRAWRQSTTENFSWQVLSTTGPTIDAINSYGTIETSGFTNYPTHWILLRPRQQGEIIYKNLQFKHVWWNGEVEVDI